MLVLITATLPINAFAETSGDYEYTVNADGITCQITGYTGSGGDITIPTTIGEYTVTSFAEYAFVSKDVLTSVTIPNGVISIAKGTFAYCNKMTSITIPNSVTSIGHYAFDRCSSLTNITIPRNVTSIGDYAFNRCTNLINITMPSSVTSIGKNAFSVCSSLTNITIPDNVTTIADKTFADCTSLSSVMISSSVTFIDSYAFYSCTSLTNITIPSSVNKIAPYAFKNCSNLANVFFDGLTYVNQFAFKGTYANLYCPNGNSGDFTTVSVQELETKTIAINSTGNGTVTPSVTSGMPGETIKLNISPDKGYCLKSGSLKYYDNSDHFINETIFTMPSSDITVFAEFELDTIGPKVDQLFPTGTGIPISPSNISIVFSKPVTSVSDKKVSVSDGSNIYTYTIEESDTYFSGTDSGYVVTIPISRFLNGTVQLSLNYNADYIVAIEAGAYIDDAGNPISESNNIGSFSTIKAYTYTVNPDGTSCTITGCSSTSGDITIPTSLNGYTVTSFAEYVFADSGVLTGVTIPSSVISIAKGAFANCSNLSSVTIKSGATSIGPYAFDRCSSLTSITIPNSVKSIGNYAFKDCSNLNSINVLNGVTSIGDSAFSYCSKLTEVIIPNSVTSIANNAFIHCSGLNRVEISSDVMSIGDNAFQGCSGLTEISVDEANTHYSSLDGVLYNFDKTSLIKYPAGLSGKFTIPSSITSIGNNAFSNCSGLTGVTIPVSVMSIEDSAFSGCINLASVTIPSSITSIGNTAFQFCAALSHAYFDGDMPTTGLFVFDSCSGSLEYHSPSGNPGNITLTPLIELQTKTVTVNTTENGTISQSTDDGMPSETISLEITPATGYRLKPGSLKYNDGSSDYIISGTSFTMPDNAITISGVFAEIDNTLPTANLVSPSGTSIALPASDIVLGFSETVTAVENKSMTISDGTNAYTYTIGASDGYVSGIGSDCKATIPIQKFLNGTVPLSLGYNTTYAVTLEAGAYIDSADNETVASNIGSFKTEAEPVTVKSVTVKTEPTKTTYTAGDALNLEGLVITLHKSNSTTEDVGFADFGTKGITTSPTNGTLLSISNTAITITYTADSKSVSQSLTVSPATSNHAPTAKSTVPTQSMIVGSNVSFTAVDIAEDEDSDALTVTGIVTEPYTTYATASLNSGAVTITGVAAGSTSVTVTVSDGNGGTVKVTVPIEVTAAAPSNHAPTAKFTVPTQSMNASSNVSFTATYIAEDEDGDALTVTGIVTEPYTTYATASLNSGAVTITGVAAGSTSVTVTVSDGNGGTVNVTVPIEVTAAVPSNHAPTAKSTVPIQSMNVSSNVSFTATYIAKDEDGDALTITGIVIEPDSTYATASLNSGALAITGVATGSTSIVVTVSDGNGGTVNVTVPIEVTATAEVEISIKQSPFKTILNAITFGLFFDDTVDVSISCTDIVDHYEYQTVSDGDTFDESGIWTQDDSFSIVPDFKGRVYARSVYGNGTTSAYTVRALVVDKTKPTISTSYDASTGSIEVSVTDDGAGIEDITYQVGTDAEQTINLEPSETLDITTQHSFTINSLPDGNYNVVINASDNSGNEAAKKTVPVDRGGMVPTINTNSLDDSVVGTAYSDTLTATGDTPIIWSIDSSDLPDGLTLDPNTGEISGTPTTDGTFSFTVKAENSEGDDTKALSIKIDPATPTGTAPTINTNSLDDGVVGTAYSDTLTATGDTPIIWSIDSGDLPDGLTLDPNTGDISGTTTTAGIFDFTVKAENSDGDDTKALSIEISTVTPSGMAPTITTNSLSGGTVGSPYSQALATASVTPITWSIIGSLPNGLTLNGSTISGTPTTRGTFSFTVKAINSEGDDTKTLSIYISPASSGNDGGNNGGGSSGSSSITPTIAPDRKPDQPVIATSPLTPTVDANGKTTITVPQQIVVDTINKAIAEAAREGRSANGIGVSMEMQNSAGTKSLGIVLTQHVLKLLTDSKVRQFEVDGGLFTLDFDLEALNQIRTQSTGDVTVTIAPATGLSEEAKTLIGTRTVYNITLSYVKDGKTVNITSLNKGSVTLSIPYTPGKNEAVGYLFGVYVDGNGKVTRIDDSTYDANSKSVIFNSNHFSVYGVGYTAPSADFSDIYTHWAKENIDYVLGRGLLAGTSDTIFSPDTSMTRGMLVTALGRLAGVDTKAYTTSSFIDVNVDSSFLPFIEWAYKKGIMSGIWNQQFAPDRAVTREEIAVILQNYAKATGYTLPTTREVATFADNSNISISFKGSVKAMQQAGIMSGKDNGYFDPKGSATRAEVATMLHRYIKLTIDPDTAQGWALNDDGQRMYYRDGKALTGWQTIDGKVYCFDNKGGAYEKGWKQDDKGNWYYFWSDGAITGWWDIGGNGNNKRYYFTKDGIMVVGK